MTTPIEKSARELLYAAGYAPSEINELLIRKSDLRDKFARAALQGILAKGPSITIRQGETIVEGALCEGIAHAAYQIADDMLKVRALSV